MKKKILAIVGESGSGKTLVADYIEKTYGIPMVLSYTDRSQRYFGEKGHIFLTKREFDQLHKEDMVAYTSWREKRYCCLHRDIQEANTYVIDESGYNMLLKQEYLYDIRGLRMIRSKEQRIKDVGVERVARDKGMFDKFSLKYDYMIKNNGSKKELFDRIDQIVEDFFYE